PAEPKDKEEVTLELLDSAGKVLRKLSSKEERPADAPAGDDEGFGVGGGPRRLPAKAGLNRFAWELRTEEATRFRGMILWGATLQGPVVPPGSYQARLTAFGKTVTEPFEVKRDPRLSTTEADLQKQYEL